MATVTVGTLAELRAALDAASGLDRIELKPGNYDDYFRIANTAFDTPLTIASADPTNPAIFTNRLHIENISGLTLENLEFRLGESVGESGRAQVQILSSQNIVLDSVNVQGRVANEGEGRLPEVPVGPDNPANKLIEGVPFGLGILIRSSQNVEVANAEVSVLKGGISIWRSDEVSVSNANIHNIRANGVTIAGSQDVSITDSLFHSFKPFPGPHPDYIQFFVSSSQRSVENVTIAGNAFLQGDGGLAQGIFGNHSVGSRRDVSEFTMTNFRIHDNLIQTQVSNGIYLSGVQHAEIFNNTLLPAETGIGALPTKNPAPAIVVRNSFDRLEDGSYDLTRNQPAVDIAIHDNIVAPRRGDAVKLLSFREGEVEAQQIVVGDNTKLDFSPGDADYWGDLFPTRSSTERYDLSEMVGLDIGGVRELSQWVIDAAAAISVTRPTDLFGGAGDDTLTGSDDGARLFGGDGDDELIGGDRIDILVGGPGSDTMTGGGRGDKFVLGMSAPGTVDEDVITDLDFSKGDKIIFDESFNVGIFFDAADRSNKLFIRGGAMEVDSDADIVEMLLSPYASLGSTGPGDVTLLFDFNRDGLVDYRLVLKDYPIDFSKPLPEGAPGAVEEDDDESEDDFEEDSEDELDGEETEGSDEEEPDDAEPDDAEPEAGGGAGGGESADDDHSEAPVVEAPRFAEGDAILIEGFPAGYFLGANLPSPAGVTDGSAVVIESFSALSALIGALPAVAAVPRGEGALELRFSDDDALIASFSLAGIEGVSSFRIAYGEPSATLFEGFTDGADRVSVVHGSFVYEAGAGDDFISGGGGDDWIEGGAGDDVIFGGRGDDTMIGGDGADVFSFSFMHFRSGERDLVADLSFSEGDSLRLSSVTLGVGDDGEATMASFNIGSVESLLSLAQRESFTLERAFEADLRLTYTGNGGTREILLVLDEPALAQLEAYGVV